MNNSTLPRVHSVLFSQLRVRKMKLSLSKCCLHLQSVRQLVVDASIQFLETKASGIGVKVGFLNYFGKDSQNDVQAIPLAFMFRYYPESKGWFAGMELGYAFLNNLDGTSGGYFGRPQLGLHYDFWNYFIYYDVILTEESNVTDIHAIGLGVTYNVRFK